MMTVMVAMIACCHLARFARVLSMLITAAFLILETLGNPPYTFILSFSPKSHGRMQKQREACKLAHRHIQYFVRFLEPQWVSSGVRSTLDLACEPP